MASLIDSIEGRLNSRHEEKNQISKFRDVHGLFAAFLVDWHMDGDVGQLVYFDG